MKSNLGNLDARLVFAVSWAGVAVFSWLFLLGTTAFFAEGLGQLFYIILFFAMSLTFWQSFGVGIVYGKK